MATVEVCISSVFRSGNSRLFCAICLCLIAQICIAQTTQLSAQQPRSLKPVASGESINVYCNFTAIISVFGLADSPALSVDFTKPSAFASQPIIENRNTDQPLTQQNQVSIGSATDESIKIKPNEKTYPRYFALIIGVSNYQFAGTSITDLSRPRQDAIALKKTLVDLYRFDESNVQVLEDATRAQIIDELDHLGTRLTEKDNLLVFYAGHGYWDDNLQIGYWLPSDANPAKKSSWISNSTIKDYVAGIKTKHTLLISDACFSGSIFKVREVEPLSEAGLTNLYSHQSRKAMTSGNMKTVPDDSKFFQYLNKRLIENTHEYLSARQLFSNFYVAVINNTSTVPQYGVIQETGDEGGEFIFIRRK